MAFEYIRQFLASEAFKNTRREIRDVVPRLVKFVCFVQVTKTHLLTVALCYGPGMLPTIGLAENNLCLAERISTQFDRFGVGDIVMVRSPEAPLKTVAKRLIATEGQSVTYVVDPKNGHRSETIVRETTSMPHVIRGISGRFLTGLLKAESSGGRYMAENQAQMRCMIHASDPI